MPRQSFSVGWAISEMIDQCYLLKSLYQNLEDNKACKNFRCNSKDLEKIFKPWHSTLLGLNFRPAIHWYKQKFSFPTVQRTEH